MSCISAKVKRASKCCKTAVTSIIALCTFAITHISSTIVKITRQHQHLNVAIGSENRPIVNIGLVCTVSVSEELEMWWCDGWRILWNNRLNMIWQEGEQ